MKFEFLEDGCRLCGSQEWNDEYTDVEHAKDCAAPVFAEMREMLLALEWGDYTDIGELPCCPLCLGVKRKGHAPDCKLGALLGKLR